MSNSSIWPIDSTLSGAITPSQSGPGRDGNKGVLCILQSSRFTKNKGWYGLVLSIITEVTIMNLKATSDCIRDSRNWFWVQSCSGSSVRLESPACLTVLIWRTRRFQSFPKYINAKWLQTAYHPFSVLITTKYLQNPEENYNCYL